MDINIIKAGMEHLDYLLELNKTLHLDIPKFEWDTKDYITEEISKGRCYIAKDTIRGKDKFVGSISMTSYGKTGGINKLMVDKSYQGKGIGKSLVNFAIDWSKARGKNELLVESFCQYNVAEFYKNCGFEQDKGLIYYHGTPFYCFTMKI
jgi:GNAT superfamily N-acetyltransferase